MSESYAPPAYSTASSHYTPPPYNPAYNTQTDNTLLQPYSDPMIPYKQNNKCCYTCCGTTKRKLCCALSLVITAVAISLLCFFLIPRKPTVCVSVSPPYAFAIQSTPSNGVANQYTIQTKVQLNISIDNQNYYGFTLDNTLVTLYYNTAKSGSQDLVAVATDNAPSIDVSARGNSTVDTVLTFNTNPNTGAAYSDIASDCTVNSQTTLYYEINTALPVLSTNFHIDIGPNSVIVQCPPAAAAGAVVLDSQPTNNANQYFCQTSN